KLFTRLGELGYLGLRYPEAYGGADADTVTYCLFAEELARGSLSLAAAAAMQSLMGTSFIHRYASEALRQRYLVPALRGEKVATFALTEPNAGSDLAGITTRAERRGDGWVLSGTKTWVTNAPVADVLTVAAKTAALSVGVARAAYEAALAYARQRQAFGKPIVEHQAIGFKLADMLTSLHVAAVMTYQAAAQLDAGRAITREAAIAKLFASEM